MSNLLQMTEQFNQTPVVLVTGAAKRIGAAIVQKFHQQGCKVIIHCNRSQIDAQALQSLLCSQRANSATIISADLLLESDRDRLAQKALESFGRLDVLVNNASTFYPTVFGTVTEPQWNELLDSNLRAAFFLCQAFKDELQLRNGAIINLVDIHADNPLKHHSVYNIAKAGLKAMTKSLAKDLAPEIRVNGVSPGAILWPQNLEGKSDKAVEDAKKDILSQIPLGHLGTPDDIAEAVYFLARKASYITGQVIRVDGGRALS